TSDSPIAVGEGKVEIHDDGIVTTHGHEVATVTVVTFPDNSKLLHEGLSRFVWTGPDTGVQVVSNAPVKAGYLERSNVNAIDEMVHLMSAYREFEAVQRSVKTLMSDLNSKLIQELGKLS